MEKHLKVTSDINIMMTENHPRVVRSEHIYAEVFEEIFINKKDAESLDRCLKDPFSL